MRDDQGKTIDNKRTEADAVAEIARRGVTEIATLNMKGVPPLIVHPQGGTRTVESLERFEATPRRKRALIKLRAHDSFIDYVQQHKEAGTLLLCDIGENGGSFTAILDYHRANVSAEETGIGAPRWGEHVCIYTAEFTPEWKRWRELSGKPMSQVAMAVFIEESMFDIADPAPAQMLELVKTLEATQGVKFKSTIRLENGDRQLGYAVETGAKAGAQGDMEVPQRFRLNFAVFTNGPTYDIECRFRYNINSGDLVMGFEIVKPHKIVELALVEARNAIQSTLDMPVLLGSGGVARPTS